jgi:hypothetical protein
MDEKKPLFIPVILGTARKGRMSDWAARLLWQELAHRPKSHHSPSRNRRRSNCSSWNTGRLVYFMVTYTPSPARTQNQRLTRC